jgi:anti-anti-sigma factor
VTHFLFEERPVRPDPRNSGPAPTAFTLKAVHQNLGTVFLLATGEVDLAAANALRALLRAAGARGHSKVHLDLAAVTFLDCTCLGVLVGERRRLRDLGGDLVLVPVSAAVSRVLVLTGLETSLLGSSRLRAVPPYIPVTSAESAVPHAEVIELHRRERNNAR